MEEAVYHDEAGRAYTVRDGQSVWLEDVSAAQAPRFEYVGFGLRAAARLIDLLLTYALAFVTGIVVVMAGSIIAGFMGSDIDAFLTRLDATSAAGFALSLLAASAFHVFAEALHGSTPGKLILGITVRAEDGRPCGFGQAALRELGFFVDGLFFGLVALSSMGKSSLKQRYGDRWAKTVVVKTKSLPAEDTRPAMRFVGATAAACVAYSALAALSMLV